MDPSFENQGKDSIYLGQRQVCIIDLPRKFHEDKFRPSLTELPENMNET